MSGTEGIPAVRGREDVNGIHAAGAPAAVIGGQRVELLDRARVYACGITPYDVTHLGHAATFAWVDTLGRTLRFLGVEPEVCRNVTDVDDVLDAAARRAGSAYDTFAAIQQFQFERDMAALNVRAPEHEPRAHRYVEQVIRLASGLLDAGAAYAREGNVYFRGGDVASRAGLERSEAIRLSGEYAGRPDDPAKGDPLDTAIWQASEAGHPAWDSPWGPGRPGWHAECAAMAMSALGASVDILAGGEDLRFPHHAYQAAMAEAASSVAPFARAHLHVGTVHQDGAKMAKTTGNLTLVADLLRDHPPAAVRLLVLNRPWHAPWEYRAGDLATAAGMLEELYAAAARPDATPSAAAAVTDALLDNLDVPRALAAAGDGGGEAARLVLRVLALA